MSETSHNCYQHSADYRRLRIWWYDPTTKYVGWTTTVQVVKGLTRRQRYDELVGYWTKAKITPPPYKPAKSETTAPITCPWDFSPPDTAPTTPTPLTPHAPNAVPSGSGAAVISTTGREGGDR